MLSRELLSRELGKWITILFVVFTSFLTTELALADIVDEMEKALMPGVLAKAHAEFEEKCTECHKFFSQESQRDKCLECHDHENVAKDIENKEGYHGRIPNVEKRECKTCHREHLGREASIIFFDQQTFDHGETDFKLRGGHLDVPCQKCHKKDKKGKEIPYHKAPKKCLDCHEEDEPHKGKLGKVCESCHRESSWNDFQFDHSRTKFALKGKHMGVECRDCHPQERYLSVPKECYSCHRGNDKHKKRFGEKCDKCHAPVGWATQHFDHDKDTDFELTGEHKRVACDLCHKEDVNAYEEDRKPNCYACHKFSDEHKGEFGKKCEECHTTKAWGKKKFDHEKTDFPLKGKHKDVVCQDCHPGNLFKDKVDTDCYVCHKQHDVHTGQQGKKCYECHNEAGWLKKVHFDHDIVNFPLLGAHASLACEECHGSSNYKDTKPICGICHREDDNHKRRLGDTCGLCHNSSDFKVWEFDHDKQTDHKLEGAHKGIDCMTCHRDVVKKTKDIKLTTFCYGCHAGDDVHDGGFGQNCERCHNQKKFEEAEIN